MGKNTRVITVTAPNGTVKKYTVVITREAQQSTAAPSGGSNGTTTTTQPQPTKDALEVSINGVEMVIADTRPSATLPDNYEWSTTEINGLEIPAAKQPASGLTLLYLTRKEGDDSGAFYLYDAQADSFQPFRQLKGVGAAYTVHNLPDTETGPAGTIPGTVAIDGATVTAYVYEDPALADYTILYLTSPDGASGLYTYDRLDGTVQRYHAVVVPQEGPADTVPEPPVDNTPLQAFFARYKTVIFTGTLACCALAVLIAAVVLAIRLSPKGGQKH